MQVVSSRVSSSFAVISGHSYVRNRSRQCIQCTTIISRRQEDNALADMVAGRSMLQYSIGYLMVHRRRHTRRLESSQHRLHRHRPSFVCSQRQQAMHSVYNHNFSPPGRQCAGRHGCWAQHAPILNWLPHGTPKTPHKASRVQPASAAPSSAVIRISGTEMRAYRMGYGDGQDPHDQHVAQMGLDCFHCPTSACPKTGWTKSVD